LIGKTELFAGGDHRAVTDASTAVALTDGTRCGRSAMTPAVGSEAAEVPMALTARTENLKEKGPYQE
jgi:hypothetical protein